MQENGLWWDPDGPLQQSKNHAVLGEPRGLREGMERTLVQGACFLAFGVLTVMGQGTAEGSRVLSSYPSVPKWGKWEMGKNVYLWKM